MAQSFVCYLSVFITCMGSSRGKIFNEIFNNKSVSQKCRILVVAVVRRSPLSYHHCHLAASHQIGPNFGFIKSSKEQEGSWPRLRLRFRKTAVWLRDKEPKLGDCRNMIEEEREGPVSNCGLEAQLSSTCPPVNLSA